MSGPELSAEQQALYTARLLELRVEHRDLDDVIRRLEDAAAAGPGAPPEELQIRRLKKRKLLLKDQIAWIRRQLDPDIPA
jgi:hypothetical protein